MPLSRDQITVPCLVLTPSEHQVMRPPRDWAALEVLPGLLAGTWFALNARTLASTQTQSFAELCKHYA
ncbi:hypothetical protein [Pseudomonas brassicacearum]|jgi:hypothetical protein|uniref:Uncharacterized protein n=1 Tax=Pseudomonas brassicacearum subsp. neoaurantiaca TaxID=494916 RepID=A0A7V8UBF7_9PSED|nr:hypothetical protein [Pseudomonas brassicacearum]MBA1376884.1 hypothetical protein [Pseudomonas brassicacearum subsp. neoaurantiaca]